ncbi:MAG: hypothetical protein RLZZ273_1695 [Bacteroidota bacterium]
MNTRALIRTAALSLFALLFVVGANAQNTYKRLSILEEFTSATCPPCAPVGEMLKDVIMPSNNVVSVRFHMNWPAPNDPWNLDNPTDNDSRRNFYAVSGIPDGYLNGKKVSLGAAPTLIAAINADNAKKSPIEITVTDAKTTTGGNVTVKIKTNVDLKAHKLHVAVVSYFAAMPDLPQTLANSNGETEFYDAMNKMLPNAGGTSMSMSANEEKTFTFSYNSKSAPTWPEGMQYVVAYVQANSTKEVLNAGTNLVVFQPVVEVEGTKFDYIAKSGSKTQTIKVTNPTESELPVAFTITNADALASAGWSVSMDKDIVSLKPGTSTTVTVTTTSGSRAYFAGIDFAATPQNVAGIAKEGKASFGYLTEGAKVVVWAGISNGNIGNYIPAMETTYGPDVVYIPATNECLEAYNPTSFDVGIFSLSIDGRFAIPGIAQLAQMMTKVGKGVFVSAPMGLGVATYPDNQSQPGYPEANAWLTQKLGLSLKSSSQRYSGNTLTPFAVNGVTGDEVGMGGTWNCNRPTNNWPFYVQITDIMSINNGSNAISWAYADGNKDNIVGIRCANPGDGRVVYSSFGVEHSNDQNARKGLMERIIKYLMPAGNRPEISINAASLDFGYVAKDAKKEMAFVITNTGKADLVINLIDLAGADATDFDITEGRADANNKVTVAPGGKHTVRAQFWPSAEKASSASITIASNAGDKMISMKGTSVATSVETDVVSETGAIGMTLAGSNPVTASTAIRVRANDNVTLTVINAAGETVATIFNGVVSGTETVSLGALNVAAGTYNVVASNGTDRAVLSIVVVR